MDLKTLKFGNIGMGVSVASDWFDINGQRKWISFLAGSEGRGKRRKWAVTASNHQGEKPVHIQAQIANGFRYEAAELALQEITKYLGDSHTESLGGMAA